MMLTLIPVTILVVVLPFSVTQASTHNGGDGITYRLNVVQDVCLERGSTNFNYLQYLLVGRHPQYPKKRSLVQFENLPLECPVHKIRWAKMYLYFAYSHKASGHTVIQTPYISRPIQVHLVKKAWAESQATSVRRLNGINWSQPYLDLNNNDAEATPQDCATTIYSFRPSGFVEFDVTRAVRSWRKGTPNHGMLLWATDENLAGRDLRFASNAHPDSKKHAFINVMCEY
ncbi:uncharacterized protein LOC116298980 [Actinia tenebrosa]|uniref:Uncharacterized protein LOC116298980 n=1 Tax=Actinia tenebrosa TaxID=6105 RepID=A0A6P8ICI4_ACTTE|nr:uncharacterized protein LOC116298980 [Actinia tenebrosa]XP_031563442.1 uncharacterized protein LOC116298980 [Actinia tenebrosa]